MLRKVCMGQNGCQQNIKRVFIKPKMHEMNICWSPMNTKKHKKIWIHYFHFSPEIFKDFLSLLPKSSNISLTSLGKFFKFFIFWHYSHTWRWKQRVAKQTRQLKVTSIYAFDKNETFFFTFWMFILIFSSFLVSIKKRFYYVDACL